MSSADGGPGTAPVARRLWETAEAVHALAYFDRDVRRAVRAAGAPGFWPGYFGVRLAPLRTADPWLATAVLHVFARSMVAAHLPSADDGARWHAARSVAVARVLAELGGPDDAGPPPGAWAAAAERVRRVVEGLDVGGRPLFAALVGSDWPEDPRLALWHGVTLLREHRGDGHVQVLVGEGLSGCEAMLLALRWRGHGAAADEVTAADRGWTRDEIAAAYSALGARGWVGSDGELTDAGRRARAAIEDATDARAVRHGRDGDALRELVASLEPFAALARPRIPASNPIGVPGTQPV